MTPAQRHVYSHLFGDDPHFEHLIHSLDLLDDARAVLGDNPSLTEAGVKEELAAIRDSFGADLDKAIAHVEAQINNIDASEALERHQADALDAYDRSELVNHFKAMTPEERIAMLTRPDDYRSIAHALLLTDPIISGAGPDLLAVCRDTITPYKDPERAERALETRATQSNLLDVLKTERSTL